MLPVSSRDGLCTPFMTSLFTSTSAVCVTGLVLVDTASYWSAFGQTIILILIQIGGLGVITVATSFALLSGRKISLLQRNTMQESVSAHHVGGIVRLTGFILIMTFIFESLGAAAMIPVFCRDFGARGIWMAVFHSVSAFCNAGFDIMGCSENTTGSMSYYSTQPLINITLMLLIIIGGIGFLTWDDIRTNGFKISKYKLQSKIVLVTSLFLIVFPALYFFFFDFSGRNLGERIIISLFQSITPRTAGFSTVDINSLSGSGQSIITVLMLIGGSPGSTAGGMKTTTIAVLLASAVSVFRNKEDTCIINRRLDTSAVKNASSILMLYVMLFLVGGIAISLIETIPIEKCLFETASAVGTVGLSMGITSDLCAISQSILIILMFLGRVGGLTLIYAVLPTSPKVNSKLPVEKIIVG